MAEDLGSARATGVIAPADAQNAGNWTVTFDPPTLGVNVAEFECYRIVISGPVGSTFEIYRGSDYWDNVTPGDINSWDPHQPMPLVYGTTVYFYWSTSVEPAPIVTMYFRTRSLL